MAWAGWGAGPAGAGSAGPPGRVFLAVAMAGSALVALVLARDGKWPEAALAAAGAAYFGLRTFGVLGRGGRS